MSDATPHVSALPGGRMAAQVVRVGDTVRKPQNASSEFMARLLRLLEQQGFSGAPRYLGQESGMDVLTFIEGQVPDRFRPWSDNQVRAAARLLRAMHDATYASTLTGRFDVVCHHDPGPNNTVFRDGVPVAFIDFSEAAPGDRLEDVGYLAWTWSVSSKMVLPLRRQAEQVRIIADAYGLHTPQRHALVDCILEQQLRNVRFWAQFHPAPGVAPADARTLQNRIDWSRREHNFTCRNRAVLDAALV